MWTPEPIVDGVFKVVQGRRYGILASLSRKISLGFVADLAGANWRRPIIWDADEKPLPPDVRPRRLAEDGRRFVYGEITRVGLSREMKTTHWLFSFFEVHEVFVADAADTAPEARP